MFILLIVRARHCPEMHRSVPGRDKNWNGFMEWKIENRQSETERSIVSPFQRISLPVVVNDLARGSNEARSHGIPSEYSIEFSWKRLAFSRDWRLCKRGCRYPEISIEFSRSGFMTLGSRSFAKSRCAPFVSVRRRSWKYSTRAKMQGGQKLSCHKSYQRYFLIFLEIS